MKPIKKAVAMPGEQFRHAVSEFVSVGKSGGELPVDRTIRKCRIVAQKAARGVERPADTSKADRDFGALTMLLLESRQRVRGLAGLRMGNVVRQGDGA